jgi:hypothetical protein
VEEIQQRLIALLRPEHFTPLRRLRDESRLRDRILTLPVMVAVILSLIWRQVPSLRQVVAMLEEDGLLWLEPIRVSRQAVSQRLRSLPAKLMAELFDEVIRRLGEERDAAVGQRRPSSPLEKELRGRFSAVWITDGSTLDALWRRSKQLKEESTTLAGKMMMIVDAWSQLPVRGWYAENPNTNEQTFGNELLAEVPENGLLIFDMGLFAFPFFDRFTESHKWFITRLKEKVAYDRLETLGVGPHWRDERVQFGKYRSNPCQHPTRIVSVRWGKTWHHYVTNVLDSEQLSAEQVVALYRQRWRIEEAFLLTKRMLGLSYFWSAGSNGVQLQLYATWIFYAVLMDLCQQTAWHLRQPLDRISVEMVFRSIYHYGRAILRGEEITFVQYLRKRQERLGIVKAKRKRNLIAEKLNRQIWGSLRA